MPPSAGQTVRNITRYSYFDNGWQRTSTDSQGIATSYDYNPLGQQTLRTLTSAGGSSDRTMVWDYYPDGKLKSRSDSGTPVGKHEAVVDNSDTPRVTYTGPGATRDTTGTGYQGFDYHRAPEGTFTWNPVVPADGTYEVFARYPATTGATQTASYTVDTGSTRTTKSVNQTQAGGTWVSLGNHQLTAGTAAKVELTDGTAAGDLLADAVKLVRDNTGVPDNEAKTFSHVYDANANLTALTDSSPGASVDSYAMAYNGLNQLTKVEEKLAATVKNTTSFTYNENGAIKTRDHDRQDSVFDYNTRDLLQRVTNTETGGTGKVTAFTYSPRGQIDIETKANGNTVDHGYHLDGALASQIEKKNDGTLVAQHLIEYTANGNRATDHTKIQNADDHAGYLEHIYNYTYDPRERLTDLAKKTPAGATVESETYRHDANSNVIDQTVDGTQTQFTYDRNRLVTTTTGGSAAAYNYDPFGRLDTVSSAGQIIEQYVYDGFDRTTTHRKRGDGGGLISTNYTYDPLDRTTAKTDKAGTPEAKNTDFAYLGLTDKVIAEEIAGQLDRTYQYDAYGRRLTQQKKDTDGSGPEVAEDSFYGYNPHTDVETLTTTAGDTKATYGYTAYGSDDEQAFTGIDKPDTQNPGKEPFNFYRYTGKRFDPASGSYDMGFRDYQPGINRFTVRDTYNGALADMKLGTSTWTGNRYSMAGGNPITGIEIDGHIIYLGDGSASIPRAAASDTTIANAERRADAESPDAYIVDPKGANYHDDRNNETSYEEASFWDGFSPTHGYILENIALADLLSKKSGPLSTELFDRWVAASGDPYKLSPEQMETLVNDEDMQLRIKGLADRYASLAISECKGVVGQCSVSVDSMWQSHVFKEDDDLRIALHSVEVRLSGSLTVTTGKNGAVNVSGSYGIDVSKRYNFDLNEPVPMGPVDISLEPLWEAPHWGLARNYTVSGSSQMSYQGNF